MSAVGQRRSAPFVIFFAMVASCAHATSNTSGGATSLPSGLVPASSASSSASAPAQSVPVAPSTASARATAGTSEEDLPPTDPALAAVMRRAPEPWSGACFGPTFTKFHLWNQTSPLEALYAAVWIKPGEHAIPPMSPSEPRAAQARCIAIGPHTAFNPMNWCCR
jgi:hypothetical protein